MGERYCIAHVAFLTRGSPETGLPLYSYDVGVIERWILGLSSRRRIGGTPTTLDYGPFHDASRGPCQGLEFCCSRFTISLQHRSTIHQLLMVLLIRFPTIRSPLIGAWLHVRRSQRNPPLTKVRSS